MAEIGVIGSGSWGTALALVLNKNGHHVTIWSYLKEEADEIREKRENPSKLPGVHIPEEIEITTDLQGSVEGKDVVVLAVPSMATRATAKKMCPYVKEEQILVNVAKGIEEGTLKTLSEQIEEEIPQANVAVLSGPSHAEEVSRELPTTVVVGAETEETAIYLQKIFMNDVFRVYTSPDIKGIELGGSLKNVIALAAGVADGLGYGDNTKAALITRGIAEITRLGIKMGGKLESFTGLTGIGDLIVTCASKHSRNRKAGVLIGGAKNAALAILAAAIMTDETVTIDNLPDVNDINVLLEAISGIGAEVDRIDRHTVRITGSNIENFDIEYDYIKKIRASYYLLGALLGKYKRAEVALPGGCNIGSRPIDQHLKGFRALGAYVDIEHGKIIAEAERLIGKHIYFDVVSVGATINVMMAASMAEGLTILENVAKEPHVVDVANFLNSMGANIRGAGTDVIKIRGVSRLHKTDYSIIPDQIEAGTFMFAAAATRGDVTVMNVIPKHLEATIAKLVEIGCEVEEFDDAVRVVSKGDLHNTQVKTLPYPGFPTDMQPQIGVTLALCKGTSTITESIFENRFKYLSELARMGANVKVEGNAATIEGVDKFSGARVSAPDLRAGAALVIAGMAADGITIVDDIVYIQRGYERFEEKLRSLGAVIERVSTEREIQKFKLKVG